MLMDGHSSRYSHHDNLIYIVVSATKFDCALREKCSSRAFDFSELINNQLIDLRFREQSEKCSIKRQVGTYGAPRGSPRRGRGTTSIALW
jgi:hypothetical protein